MATPRPSPPYHPPRLSELGESDAWRRIRQSRRHASKGLRDLVRTNGQ